LIAYRCGGGSVPLSLAQRVTVSNERFCETKARG
jgi:hypothetical protein